MFPGLNNTCPGSDRGETRDGVVSLKSPVLRCELAGCGFLKLVWKAPRESCVEYFVDASGLTHMGLPGLLSVSSHILTALISAMLTCSYYRFDLFSHGYCVGMKVGLMNSLCEVISTVCRIKIGFILSLILCCCPLQYWSLPQGKAPLSIFQSGVMFLALSISRSDMRALGGWSSTQT